MPQLPWFAPLRGLVAGLAVLIIVVITVSSVLLLEEGNRTPFTTYDLPAGLAPTLPTSPPVADGPGVRVTPPRLIAIASSRVADRTLRKIADLEHVQKVAAADGGIVRVSGTGLRLLAVDPVQFRSWTPAKVAEHPEVWSALERGELVAESATVRRLGMVLGAEYQVDGGPRLRVAASATLGLPGVDGLVSKDLGGRLGFKRDVVILVHGDPGKISGARIARLLGPRAQIVMVGEGAGATGQEEARQARPGRRTPQSVVGHPETYLELYQRAAMVCPGLSWTVLAAIGQVESNHGRNNGPSSAGALGPMQFMPATWKTYGVDGDGDGEADIWSPYDAVPSAAAYLCANGAGLGGEKLRKSVWFYNHSWSYVNKVLGLAEAYARDYPAE